MANPTVQQLTMKLFTDKREETDPIRLRVLGNLIWAITHDTTMTEHEMLASLSCAGGAAVSALYRLAEEKEKKP